eukprot:Colp12_sorted_trinity150504_noHs@33292
MQGVQLTEGDPKLLYHQVLHSALEKDGQNKPWERTRAAIVKYTKVSSNLEDVQLHNLSKKLLADFDDRVSHHKTRLANDPKQLREELLQIASTFFVMLEYVLSNDEWRKLAIKVKDESEEELDADDHQLPDVSDYESTSYSTHNSESSAQHQYETQRQEYGSQNLSNLTFGVEQLSVESTTTYSSTIASNVSSFGDIDSNSVTSNDSSLPPVNTATTVNSGATTEKAKRGKNMPKEAAKILRQWLAENEDNPYPSAAEKERLAELVNQPLKAVNHWFNNVRARDKQIKLKREAATFVNALE